MPVAKGRLNRRRYREAVACLKELIGDKKQSAQRRLRSVEMLLEIYGRHDRLEQRKDALRKGATASEPSTGGEDKSDDLENILERMQADRDEGGL